MGNHQRLLNRGFANCISTEVSTEQRSTDSTYTHVPVSSLGHLIRTDEPLWHTSSGAGTPLSGLLSPFLVSPLLCCPFLLHLYTLEYVRGPVLEPVLFITTLSLSEIFFTPMGLIPLFLMTVKHAPAVHISIPDSPWVPTRYLKLNEAKFDYFSPHKSAPIQVFSILINGNFILSIAEDKELQVICLKLASHYTVVS